jgi:SAM-dependent methyltransferase
MLNSGERQVAPTIDGIRRDHVARYEWATKSLPQNSRVIDVACGVGYGAFILAQAGHSVLAFDRDAEAIAYARQNYAHENISFRCCEASDLAGYLQNSYDAAICFEIVEHIADPLPILKAARAAAPLLLVSVPNESVFPFRNYAFHHRHYTRQEFETLLGESGFAISQMLGQKDAYSDVSGTLGRTLVAIAERAEHTEEEKAAAPRHVAILGLGPSLAQFLSITRGLGGRSAYCDEVWAINALGDVFQCDLIFHMDDVRVQEIRAAAAPDSNIAKMLQWLKTTKTPIVTSRAHPDYPSLVDFPLEDVINDLGFAYLNNTAAYALAYAIHIGVKKVSLFGCDYTYPNAHHAEKGRACLEYWLGFAKSRGVEIATGNESTLMDACVPWDEKLYGYDTLRVVVTKRESGEGFSVSFKEREKLPTAEEIEDRYDHSRHPNRICDDGAE